MAVAPDFSPCFRAGRRTTGAPRRSTGGGPRPGTATRQRGRAARFRATCCAAACLLPMALPRPSAAQLTAFLQVEQTSPLERTSPFEQTSPVKPAPQRAPIFVVEPSSMVEQRGGLRQGMARSDSRGHFQFRYGGWTALTPAQVAAFFPATFNGGSRASSWIDSREGVVARLAAPVTWVRAASTFDPVQLLPASLLSLLKGGGPAMSDGIRYRAALESFTTGAIRTYTYGTLFLVMSPQESSAVSWTASVRMEFFCSYTDSSGQAVGILASSDVGGPWALAEASGAVLPQLLGPAQSSWGALKALFLP